MYTLRALVLAAATVSFAACGGSDSEAEEPPPAAETGDETEATSDEPLPDHAPTQRTSMTAEECEGRGGTLVGDIGDGAIHEPDYVCPSGQPPIGDVPLGVEGSVCCPP